MAEPAGRLRTRYRDEPDVVLVAAAQRGEHDALDTLLRRHHDRILAVCRRITSNSADAADATQEALLAIARGIGRFDGTSAFTTWAYRVATNASLDELRRRNRRPVPADDETFGSAGARMVTGPTSTMSSHDVDARVDIDRALAVLPPDWRAALVLRDLCGLDYAEIAEVLSIPGGTVRSRIARARAALAPVLADKENPAPEPHGHGNQVGRVSRPKETHVD